MRTSEVTLIELLVVMVIIGVLAGIALPIYLSQTEKAQDSVAQSNARSLASEVEVCNVEARDFRECDEASELNADGQTGLPIGTGPGRFELACDPDGGGCDGGSW